MDDMRIAMISTPFVPVPPKDYGGTELVVHELVAGLLDLEHDVTLFATVAALALPARRMAAGEHHRSQPLLVGDARDRRG